MKKLKRKHKILIIIGSILIILCTSAAIFSYEIGKLGGQGLLFFNEGNDTKNNSLKELENWNFDLEGFLSTYEEIPKTVTASDGVEIPVTAFYADGTQDNDTAILIHGQGGDHVFVYPLAEMYLENGWNVITYDQRSSTASKSPYLTFGHFEKLDVEALAADCRLNAPGKMTAVHGQSMGAATAGLFAGMDNAENLVDVIIMDSPYDNMKNMFLGVWHQMDMSSQIPDSYVTACIDWYLKQNYGFVLGDVDVVKAQEKNTIPTLVIGSSNDNVCPIDMSKQIFDTIKTENKQFYSTNSKHIQSYLDEPLEYEKRVMEFIDSYKK